MYNWSWIWIEMPWYFQRHGNTKCSALCWTEWQMSVFLTFQGNHFWDCNATEDLIWYCFEKACWQLCKYCFILFQLLKLRCIAFFWINYKRDICTFWKYKDQKHLLKRGSASNALWSGVFVQILKHTRFSMRIQASSVFLANNVLLYNCNTFMLNLYFSATPL